MNSPTQVSLLERLREAADPIAWDEFFERYWRLIYVLARRRGCSEHSAEEVVQETMLAVFQQRQVFRYDPRQGRFRDWLSAIVRNLVAQRQRRAGAQRERAIEPAVLAEVTAEQVSPDKASEEAFEVALLASLLDVVRHEVTPETFQAFELTFIHELPAADVSRAIGLTRNAVYLARRRVVERLRELGASYGSEGQLSLQLRRALGELPRHAVQRSISEQVERTMSEERQA